MRVKLVGVLAAILATLLVSSTAWAVKPAPSSFTLSARGTVSQGVTVKPVLKKRRTIGLVVFRASEHKKVGTVPLGTFGPGRPSIHWSLKVHGKLLGPGSYVIAIRVFANGKPTDTLGPRPRQLTIVGEHVRVS